MKPWRPVVLLVAGLLLVLTYLLVEGAAPDDARHERTMNALRGLILNDAALQRDVLRAQAGLLRSYDPIVRSVQNLRRFAEQLEAAAEIADNGARAEIVQGVEAVAAAVRDQEGLAEAFKSRNALLHNSLNYFRHLIGELSDAEPREGELIGAIAALGSAMLQFTAAPEPELAAEATGALDRLDRVVAGGGPNLPDGAAALVTHGRLVVATLPGIGHLVARLQAGRITERARALEEAYLRLYARADARAGLFRLLIYAAAVGLVAYIGYLVVRLGANARSLAERLHFETLIASISTQLVNLPRDHLHKGIDEGLAQLAEHADADRAWLIMPAPDGRIEHFHVWLRDGIDGPAGAPEELLRLATRSRSVNAESRDRVQALQLAAFADGTDKACLGSLGIRSWLSIPIAHGEGAGVLVLATVRAEKRWHEADIALVRTASEIIANAIARQRDEAARQALEARLHEAQRLEAIGTLAGGIAHEFNNILGAILGYGEMALLALRRNGVARRQVQQIMKAGERAERVVDQVLAFSRRPTRQYRAIRAQPVVAEAIEFMRASVPATLVVEARLDAGDATILGDPIELQQVVMNLCTNAAQAMDGRGSLAIDLTSVDVVDEVILCHGRLSPGRYLRLIVRDTGRGIEPATMARIFEPFFTTKPVGQGSGLGLSAVHGSVTQHGGCLDVESSPGVGTTFTVYFPQTPDAAGEDPHAPAAPVPRGNGETVLFVDDEKQLVLLAEEMLAAIGYEGVGFDTSPAALAAFRADPDRFDLVLADEVMPGMTGTELAVALHGIRPDVPVILMTGYVGQMQVQRLQAGGICDVLKKPLLSAPVALCLAQHLAARRANLGRRVGQTP